MSIPRKDFERLLTILRTSFEKVIEDESVLVVLTNEYELEVCKGTMRIGLYIYRKNGRQWLGWVTGHTMATEFVAAIMSSEIKRLRDNE